MFDWYDWCYFREESGVKFPFQKRSLGRVLGPMKNEGNEMAQAVLTITGKVVPRRTCAPLTIAELNSPGEKLKRQQFDSAITKLFGNSIHVPPETVKPTEDLDMIDLTESGSPDSIHVIDGDPVDANDNKAEFETSLIDSFLHAELLLPQVESLSRAKVIGQSATDSGDPIGSYDVNPLLNSILYDVEFDDGEIKQYSANIIAENMYSQVDGEGFSKTIFDSILDYRKDSDALSAKDKYIITKSGQFHQRKTTSGWKFLVRFKDGTEQWIPLKILKETNPVDVAEFASAHDIDTEPAFSWWVPFTLRQRDRIVSKVTARLQKTTHKYGFEIPVTLEDAMRIDRENMNTVLMKRTR